MAQSSREGSSSSTMSMDRCVFSVMPNRMKKVGKNLAKFGEKCNDGCSQPDVPGSGAGARLGEGRVAGCAKPPKTAGVLDFFSMGGYFASQYKRASGLCSCGGKKHSGRRSALEVTRWRGRVSSPVHTHANRRLSRRNRHQPCLRLSVHTHAAWTTDGEHARCNTGLSSIFDAGGSNVSHLTLQA